MHSCASPITLSFSISTHICHLSLHHLLVKFSCPTIYGGAPIYLNLFTDNITYDVNKHWIRPWKVPPSVPYMSLHKMKISLCQIYYSDYFTKIFVDSKWCVSKLFLNSSIIRYPNTQLTHQDSFQRSAIFLF